MRPNVYGLQIRQLSPGNKRQAVEQLLDFNAVVGFNDTDDDIADALFELMRRLQRSYYFMNISPLDWTSPPLSRR
jgi:hypothetical protein